MSNEKRQRVVDGPEALLRVKDVAEWLGVTEWTVRNWTTHGALPRPIKLGSGRSAPIRYRRGDIQEWLDERIAERGTSKGICTGPSAN